VTPQKGSLEDLFIREVNGMQSSSREGQ